MILVELHRQLNAVFLEEKGRQIPVHFGDTSQEYQAVRHSAGLIDLSHWSNIQITGPDRKSYLHRMVTNQVNTLKPGEGNYNLILNAQGKIIADFWLLVREEELFLLAQSHLGERIINTLDKYLIMEEAEIKDISSSCALFSLQGPQAEEILKKVIGEGNIPESEYHSTTAVINGFEVTLFRVSHTGEKGFDILMAPDSAVEVMQAILDAGALPVGQEALEILRIEAGIPIVDKDIDDKVIPQEALLQHALDFEKGCYVGQEVVARLHFRGHVNRELTGFYLDTNEPPSGDIALLHEDKQVGMITSTVYSPGLKHVIGIGFLRCKFREQGNQIQGEVNGQKINAAVASLPIK